MTLFILIYIKQRKLYLSIDSKERGRDREERERETFT